MMTRREMLTISGLAVASGSLLARATRASADATPSAAQPASVPLPPAEAGRDYTPVITPNGVTLPFKIVDGVKVFHLIADEVKHEFAPGLEAVCWGYNGRVHGPTIEAVEGDRVRIYVTNRLPEPTTVHWHGVILPAGMDGVYGLAQAGIKTDETFKYEFTLRQHGTFMYHAHYDEMTQIGLGLSGMFIIHPRQAPAEKRVDRDYALLLHEWKIVPGTRRPDPGEMTEFNLLTINGRCFPGTSPLVAKLGEKVRIRFGNTSAMDHHPMHLHGYSFTVTQTGGGDIPLSAQYPDDTIVIPPGGIRAVEFIADNPGDWALHCHMTHHVMNQMGHGLPNLIGFKPGELDKKIRKIVPGYMTMGQDGMGGAAEMAMGAPDNSIPMATVAGPHDAIDMGGMFTVLKVREKLEEGVDPGWYTVPPGTQAQPATPEELKRDGIV